MKVAVFSPLNPIKSGISDFTEEVVLRLRNYVDIDLFVDNFKPTNPEIIKNFEIFDIEDINKPEIRNKYDERLYHIGNSYDHHNKIVEYSLKYPGIVEIHDFAIHHLMATMALEKKRYDEYIKIMKLCHGKVGEAVAMMTCYGLIGATWNINSIELPVNRYLLAESRGIIVHSDYAKQMIKGMGIKKPLKKIHLHTYEIIDDYEAHKIKCKEKLGIDKDKIVLGAFGFAAPSKRLIEILEAIELLKDEFDDFIFYIVGEQQIEGFDKKIKEMSLDSHVCITEFVELDEFFEYMGACDICFNLRYPTNGESSASLHRALGMGKVVFVTKIGSFNEYPGDVVVKINADQHEVKNIHKALSRILNNKEEMEERKRKAIHYAKENCSLDENCIKYSNFFNELKTYTYSEGEYADRIVDAFFDMGIKSENYIDHVYERVGNLLTHSS